MYSFADKIAVVTGAGSGIGRSLALELARRKAKVIVTDVKAERAEAVLAEVRALSPESRAFTVDHGDKESVAAFARDFFAAFGHVDVICSNAGVGAGAELKDLSLEDWEWLMRINLWGAIYMMHYFGKKMIERREGRILITASALGLYAAPAMAPYSTAKFGMVGLAESLRMELAKYNIGVSVICPGIINTNIVADGRINLCDKPGKREQVIDFYKGRGTSPDVVARDGLRALEKNKFVMPTPLHVWPPWIVKRVSPGLYAAITAYVYKKGWLV